MFYQQLKKPDQTWENLAQAMEALSIQAYMEETYAKTFVEAIVDKTVHGKL